jgi:hypothetical protein
MQQIDVVREGEALSISGCVGLSSYKRALAGLHDAVNRAGYQDVILDFSKCDRAYPAPMLALCAQVMALRNSGIDFSLKLPTSNDLNRLFFNANWAHLLDPRSFDSSRFRGSSRVPATLFTSAVEQQSAVDTIVRALLASASSLERSQFRAFEWSVNEITDNVLVHAQSRAGGLVQVSSFDPTRKMVEFDVCDPGMGIPATLRRGHPDLASDAEALDRAIREGVTTDPEVGQGNGLYGTYQVCAISKGAFQIHSGYANLTFSEKSGLHIYSEQIPYAGTLVVGRISFAEKGVLEDALKFGGKPYVPVDFVETRYETEDPEIMVFRLCQETQSCGSRIAGTPVRGRLKNLLEMSPTSRVRIDLTDVPLMSSSFADEVFGKLFAAIGPLTFMQRIQFINVPNVVRNLIDKAIMQRMERPTSATKV